MSLLMIPATATSPRAEASTRPKRSAMLGLTIHDGEGAEFHEPALKSVRTWEDVTGAVCAIGYVGAGAHWIRWPGTATFRIDPAGHLHAFLDPRADAARVRDVCRRLVVPLALQALGYETLHASAVRFPTGLVGICGDRHAGKSTLAYSLGKRGYQQHADDMLVLDVSTDEVRSIQLPFDVRLRPEAAVFWGFQPKRTDAEAVASIDLPPHAGAESIVPLAALFVLRRMDRGEPIAERLPAATAWTALLANGCWFESTDADQRGRLVRHYLAIAALVPVYELRFAPGLDRLDAVLDCIETTAANAPAAAVCTA